MATNEEAVKLYDEMCKLLSGRPTAAVYMAIGMVLGHMETYAKNPDRPNLFRIIDDVMTEMVEYGRPN